MTGLPLTQTDLAFPCGPIAQQYNMLKPEILSFGLNFPNGTAVPIKRTDIAWSSDRNRFKNFDRDRQPFDVDEENWLVWFRPAVRSNFYKLFGIVE